MAAERSRTGVRGSTAEPLRSYRANFGCAYAAVRRILQYTPSWQEVASFGGVIAYGVIVYSLSYRYLPLFASPKGENTHVSGN